LKIVTISLYSSRSDKFLRYISFSFGFFNFIYMN
jgi:hypothetical protein